MSPAPDRWHRIAALCTSARERTPASRAAFLDEVCEGDDELRREVETLLNEDVTRTLGPDRAEPELPAGALKAKSASRSPADSSPTITSSRFRVLRRVGAGGMGVVYEAWDQSRGVRSALKTLTGFDPDRLYLFKNEFRALADMSHPNLVALYELFSEQGQWFFSMEYVEGVHFLEFVRPSGRCDAASMGEPATSGTLEGPDPERIRSAVGQLTHAVQALHGAGILHRDLKPANVKVTPDGRVVVLDFGLAAHRARSRFAEATMHHGIFGTVAYMAPELAGGEQIAEPADWYAVGVMLYEALTGRRPFSGTDARILEDKRTLEAPSAKNFAPDIPDDLHAVCDGLLACDPLKRMTGAQVLSLLRWTPRDAAGAHAAPSHQHAAPRQTGEALFVGRQAELAMLRDAFDVTANGIPCAVFVHGISGIGKSAMVSRFLEDLSVRGDVVVLPGRCYEQESVPYKALDSAIDSLSRYLSRLPRHDAAELTPRDATALAQIFPVLRRVEAIADAPHRSGPAMERHELRRRAFGALRELLARLADRRRVVLYLDDLQWADVDSGQLLAEILRPPEAPAILLIASYRAEQTGHSDFVEDLVRNGLPRADLEIRDIAVSPLNEAETGELAAALLARSLVDSGRAEQIARESGGNPYFVQELIAASGIGEPVSGAPETSLDAALWSRVIELPAEARRVLEAISVSGQPIDETLICEAAGATRDPKLFGVLRSARMIRGSSAGGRALVEAWHDRVRETVVNRLPPAALRQYHLRLAEVLDSSGHADAERVAAHFEAAGETARAGRYYRVAAESASSTLAFKHSAGLFRKALDLLQPEGDEKLRLTIGLADALANAGRGGEAARHYQWAAQAAAGPEALMMERRAAYWFSVSGHVDEGREALDNLLKRIGIRMPHPRLLFASIALREIQVTLRGLKFRQRSEDAIPREELDRLDALWDVMRAFGMIDVAAGVYCTVRNVLLALKAGEPTRIARALSMGATGAAVLPAFGRTKASGLLAAVENLALYAFTPYIVGALPFTRSFMDFCLTGRWEKSLAGLREAGQIFDEKCSGVGWEMSSIRVFTLWDLMYLGRYAELSHLAASFMRDGEERGDLFQVAWIGSSMQPFAEMVAGRPEEALSLMDYSLSRWTRRKYTVQLATSAYVRAWIMLYQGSGESALNFLRSEWPAMDRNLCLRLNAVRQWLFYSRAQCALGACTMPRPHSQVDLRETLRIAESDARVLERDTVGYSLFLAQLIRAGCAARKGDMASAASLLETAAAGLDEFKMSMMAAAARRRHGQLAGGEFGLGLIRDADAAMRAEGVVDPARMTQVFVNGFQFD